MKSAQIIHISNIGSPAIKGLINISSKNDLSSIKEADINGYLIHIHLDWEGRPLSSHFGFEIANYLRTFKKSLKPIIFYSHLQKEYFEWLSSQGTKNIKYKILFGRGSGFFTTPILPKQLNKLFESIPLLTPTTLQDVNTMLCDIKGIVLDRLNHNLKIGSDIEAEFSAAALYLNEAQKSTIQFAEYKRKLIGYAASNDHEMFNETKAQFLALCEVTLTAKGSKVIIPPKKKFKVLVLDDVQSELNIISNNLSKQFEIIPFTNAENAITILQKDIKNEIVAVISDWRLYQDETQTYWQSYQGYEVLQFAATTRLRALFALTSQADFLVHQLRNLIDFKVNLFKKQNLILAEQWNLFSDVLSEKCYEIVELQACKPESVTWTNIVGGTSYKEQYIKQKLSVDGHIFFTNLEEKVNEIWSYILSESENDNYKHIALIKDKFGIEIPKNIDLLTVLIHRRLWIGLWFKLGSSFDKNSKEDLTTLSATIYKIICTGFYDRFDPKNPTVELNKICLTKKDLGNKNFLIEEKVWLKTQNFT